MSKKEQKGGQALSPNAAFRLTQTTPTEDPIKTTYSQQEGPQISLNQTETCKNLGSQPIRTKLTYDRKLHTQNHIT